MELFVKHFSELTAQELYEIYRLRVSVFVVEQKCCYQEVDDADKDAYHVWLRDEDGIAAYARVLPRGATFPAVSIGRVIAVKRRCGLGKQIVAAAIGTATAAKLREYGIRADVVPEEFRAEGVVAALKGKLPPHARVLLPRAEQAREVLPDGLRALGATVDVAPVYRTEAAAADGEALAAELAAGAYDYVTFTSSSTVRNLVSILGGSAPLAHTRAACIGPVTAETARELGIEPALVAEEYTIAGLTRAIAADAAPED